MTRPIDWPIKPPAPIYVPKTSTTTGTATNYEPAVLAMVDDPSNPKVATVYVNNTLPPDDGYTIPSSLGVTFMAAPAAWNSATAYTPGEYASVNAVAYKCVVANTNSQPPNSNWVTPSGVAFWNDPTLLDGGSWVTVDTVNKTIVSISQGESNSPPTNPSDLFQYIRHDGAYNTTGNFQNPGPIDNTQLSSVSGSISFSNVSLGAAIVSGMSVGWPLTFTATYNDQISNIKELLFKAAPSSLSTTSQFMYATSGAWGGASIPGSHMPSSGSPVTVNLANLPTGESLNIWAFLVGGDGSYVCPSSNPIATVMAQYPPSSAFPKMPSGATFTVSSVTENLVDAGMNASLSGQPGHGMLQELILGFVLGDANTPDSTNWGAGFVPYVRQHSSSNPTLASTYTRRTPFKVAASSLGNGSHQMVAVGEFAPVPVNIDVALSMIDGQGNETSLVQVISNYALNKPNLPNCPFPGGYVNPDGSWSNVDGVSSTQVYPLSTGQSFTVSVDIAKGSATGIAWLLLGNETNGYGIQFYNGGIGLFKWVAGAATELGSAVTLANDTAYHSYRLSVVVGATNSIEASLDGNLFNAQDSGVTLAGSSWPVTLYTAGANGTVLHYTATVTQFHYGPLPLPIRQVVTRDSAGNGGLNVAPTGGVTGNLPLANHDTTVQSGAAKANTAIDSSNIIVPASIDFSRSYTGKGALATKSSVDLSTSDVINKVASNIMYTGGATVDSLKPAQAGADVTSQNTSADTSKVNGLTSARITDVISDNAGKGALSIAPGGGVNGFLSGSNIQNGTIQTTHIANNAVSGPLTQATKYSTLLSNTAGSGSSATDWYSADFGGYITSSNYTIPNGKTIQWNTGAATYTLSANPYQETLTLAANASCTVVFKHLAFLSGAVGTPRVFFSGNSTGSQSPQSQSAAFSGSSTCTVAGSARYSPSIGYYAWQYSQSNGSPYTINVSTNIAVGASTPLTLSATSVNCPSSRDGTSSLTIQLKDSGGTVLNTWTGITSTAYFPLSYSTAHSADTFTWSITAVPVNDDGTTSPYNESMQDTFSGSAGYYNNVGTSGETYVLGQDGSQRLAVSDSNVQYTQLSADTIAFTVYNSASVSNTFSVGVDVAGL